MNSITITFILISIILSVIAQIMLKLGMSNPTVQQSLQSSLSHAVWTTVTNSWILCGLVAYVSSAALWLIVLSKVEVSKAYPFVGLGFIGTMLFAYWFLNEPLTIVKIVGTLLIVTGVLLIAQ